MSEFPSPFERQKWAYEAGMARDLDTVARAVLVRVCFKAGNAAGCWESQGNIGKAIGLDRKAIGRAVKRLEAAGAVQIEGESGATLRIHPQINFPYLNLHQKVPTQVC